MNFENDQHALVTGMVVGLLNRHGLAAEPIVDDDGDYTDVIEIAHDNYEFRVKVLP